MIHGSSSLLHFAVQLFLCGRHCEKITEARMMNKSQLFGLLSHSTTVSRVSFVRNKFTSWTIWSWEMRMFCRSWFGYGWSKVGDKVRPIISRELENVNLSNYSRFYVGMLQLLAIYKKRNNNFLNDTKVYKNWIQKVNKFSLLSSTGPIK